MDSERLNSHRVRFDSPQPTPGQGPHFATDASSSRGRPTPLPLPIERRLTGAIDKTKESLLARQAGAGYWLGELEGDTILESEYILLLAFLGQEGSEVARKAANYILQRQMPTGGWNMYPDGPIEISGSVKAYFALKLTGHDPNADYMVRARQAILEAGGVERVNSFTRYYLAFLGVIPYEKCPAVPPEVILFPKWFPLNIYQMSSWSRTIVVPLSLLWAYRPVREIPREKSIPELFVTSPDELSLTMPRCNNLDEMTRPTQIDWRAWFNRLDRCWKLIERFKLLPFRRRAIGQAHQWIHDRFDHSDGLGAIFPPIVWSIIGLKCLGYDENSQEIQTALHELEKLSIYEEDTVRLQPCLSPVWDTAISMIALTEADVPPEDPHIQKAVQWLLEKEVRHPGDWSNSHPEQEPGGWFFEFNNRYYPDCDDTAMVLLALRKAVPQSSRRAWSIDLLLQDWSPHSTDLDANAVVYRSGAKTDSVLQELSQIEPVLSAMRRGMNWLLAMQSRDGGWGAFDSDNNREILTRVPFADHNAMIDPSTADLTARMLEMFAAYGLPADIPAIRKAIEYVWCKQETDDCWYGRWGVNYLYGTWQALVGLTAIGASTSDPRITRAADWLKSRQHESGGWGETADSYDNPTLRGKGVPTASQTAWAIMGLLAAGEIDSAAVEQGIDFLLRTQKADGTWDETHYTGTGFPRVFYLKYHLYAVYFPLMALARYRRMKRET